MAVHQSPAFSFYPKDFLVGTVTLSLAERGAYITLLSYQWDNGSVPDDARDRCRILGCTRREADAVWERIKEKFDPVGDAWRNTRLEVERSKQADRRAALAANGSKGGRPKKASGNQQVKPNETNSFHSVKPNENQNESLSSSSSSSTPITQRAELPGGALTRVPPRRDGLHSLHRVGHQRHAFCSERICVPDFQHAKFVGAIGGFDADETLREFYRSTLAAIPDSQPIESDPLKFWPPLVSARFTPQPLTSKTAGNAAVAARFAAKGAQ